MTAGREQQIEQLLITLLPADGSKIVDDWAIASLKVLAHAPASW